MKKEIITQSENETYSLARDFALRLKGGEVIALSGELGAGKTVFAKGLAAGLKIKNTITSPTFVIMKVYNAKRGQIKYLSHIDAYRLESGVDLSAIGADEYFGRKDAITVIEWPEKIKNILPPDAINIALKHLSEKERKIIF